MKPIEVIIDMEFVGWRDAFVRTLHELSQQRKYAFIKTILHANGDFMVRGKNQLRIAASIAEACCREFYNPRYGRDNIFVNYEDVLNEAEFGHALAHLPEDNRLDQYIIEKLEAAIEEDRADSNEDDD